MRSRLFSTLEAASVRKARGWVCHECRARTKVRWQHSTSLPPQAKKPYYVTSPIFYVNAGILYSMTNISKKFLTSLQLPMLDTSIRWSSPTFSKDGMLYLGKEPYYVLARTSTA